MSICIKYKTRVIPTGCIHSRSMSVIIHNWTQSAQLEFHRVWDEALSILEDASLGSRFAQMTLFLVKRN